MPVPTSHDPDDPLGPSKFEVFDAAVSYVEAGLSLIPISIGGDKMPAFELLPKVWCSERQRHRRPWSGFKERRPALTELQAWFLESGHDTEYGIAILGGPISGELEIIDLDNWGIVQPWMVDVERNAPGLLSRLVRVKSPRPGLHCYYRCPLAGKNQKLARIPDPSDVKKPKTIIELKATAGYCLAPPSPAACHKTGRCYEFLSGMDLTMVPTITAAERDVLLDCARSLNRWKDPQRKPYTPTHNSATPTGGRPGDDFNRRADWGDILQPRGWKWAGSSGDGCDRWTRPGKGSGTSATTGDYGDKSLLYVFSTNAQPFEESTGYEKFTAYALLYHVGDFREAASTLGRMGYGSGKPTHKKRKGPFDRYAGYTTRSKRKAK